MILIKRLTATATIPTRAHKGDAGLDLYADETVMLEPNARYPVSLGIAAAIPYGWYGRIAPRSGLASNHGLQVLAGTIDAAYRGEIKVLLLNCGLFNVLLKTGDRIAQLIIERCELWEPEEVSILPNSMRGTDGWGSTGE